MSFAPRISTFSITSMLPTVVLVLFLVSSDAFRIDSQRNERDLTKRLVQNTLSNKQTKRLDNPWLCIIARAPFQPEAQYSKGVLAFLASIAAQSYDNWDLYLINPMGGDGGFEREVQFFSNSRMHLGPNDPGRSNKNTWGYRATNYALEFLLDETNMERVPSMRPKQTCDYFLFTNADNLYNAEFLETIHPGMRQRLDLLGVGVVTHHPRQSQTDNETKNNLVMQNAGFARAHVDLGAVTVSKAAILSAGARFSEEDKAADWLFFDGIMKNRSDGPGSNYYEEVLMFHQ